MTNPANASTVNVGSWRMSRRRDRFVCVDTSTAGVFESEMRAFAI
jgi:hypothetical protein